MAGGLLATVGGWHYAVHLAVEAAVQERANQLLGQHLPGWSARVTGRALTNLVIVEITRPSTAKNELAHVLADALIGATRRQLEPALDREVSNAARSMNDVYALVVPYRVSIQVAASSHTQMAAEQSELVRLVQIELLRLGYEVGRADGIAGPKTMRAISEVQRRLGQRADGLPSDSLLEALRSVELEHE